jgi:tetratricopeptide (TPR) repeat protein
MDSMIIAAARALAAGDPLGALNRVALRDDPPALALRGIAMAQVGDFDRAKDLLRRAQRAFGPKEVVARARCVVAEAEVALQSRDLSWQPQALDAARVQLEAHGDHVNAAHAGYLAARRLVLLGRLDEAEQRLSAMDASVLPPALGVAHALVAAGIALRHVRAGEARAALARAADAAERAGIPALRAEVELATQALAAPAARLIVQGEERPLLLDQVESLLASKTLVIDACRYVVRESGRSISLVSRPVLFVLARTLAESWPEGVARDALVARAFRGKVADESYRARLRVEIGRLRAALRAVAGISATKEGFVLVPHRVREVAVLARPFEEKHAGVLALLADGESWSTSALALALASSQRNVQRALEDLATQRKVQAVGNGRARRWMMPPVPGFATSLLLPAPLPGG